jgi:hypothetical protein
MRTSPSDTGRFHTLVAGVIGSLVTLVLAAGVLTATGIGFATGDEITGCVSPSGQLRVVDSIDECRPAESVLTWNEEGPPGPAPTYVRVREEGEIAPGMWESVMSSCAPGSVVVGGGYSIGSIGPEDKVNTDGPVTVDGVDAWIVSAYNPTAFPIHLWVTAICAE